MSEEEDAPTVVVKEHPQPKRTYQLTMVIENAPGPFGMIEGSAQYDVINHKTCGERNPVSGTRSRISTHPPIAWKPIGNGQYVAMVYPDLIVHEDYYGNGICRWQFTEARAQLKATGAEAETDFVPHISAADILAEKTVKLYFWGIGRYPRSQMDNFADFGREDPTEFKAEIRDQLFTISITAKEM